MPISYHLLLLIAFGTLIACATPVERPEEIAPDAEALSGSKRHDSGPPSSAGPGSPPTQSPQVSGHLEEVLPGTFATKDLAPKFTVFAPFKVPFATIDREIGSRIHSMYETAGEQGWKKEGPAIVAVRGSLEGPTVSAEVTFTLSAAPTHAEDFGLKSGTLPGGLAVIGMHKGPRVSLTETNKALDEWCATHDKTPRGDLRWFVFLNRPDQVSESELLTAVIQPVE